MNMWLEHVSFFVLHWLMHVAWIGLLIGLVALIGNRFVNGSARREYSWTLICFCLVVVAIPVAAGFALLSARNVATLAVKDQVPSIRADEVFRDAVVAVTAQEVSRNGNRNGLQPLPDNPPLQNSLGETRSIEPVSPSVIQHETQKQGSGELTPIAGRPHWAMWISLVYLAGFCLMMLRLVMASWGCRRLSHSARKIFDPQVISLAQRTARQLGLKVAPLLATCDRVVVPVVVGLWRPIILLPVSTFCQLPAEQLRAILAHEMAHLRRFDHLVVVAQRILEAVLFFHPTIWSLSTRLDRQREFCCDDLVVSIGILPLDYANSLYIVASTQQRDQTNTAGMAVAATGTNPSQLVTRIGRVLGEIPKTSLATSSSFGPLLLALALPGVLLACTLMMSNKSDSALVTESQPADNSTLADTGTETYPIIRGFVRDKNGNPIAGALIVVQEHPYKYPGTKHKNGEPRTRNDLKILARTETAMDGEFRFADIVVPEYRRYIDSAYPITVVVLHEDGIEWKHLDYVSKKPMEFSVSPSKPISFRVNSNAGKVLDDAQVEFVGLMTTKDWKEAARYDRSPEKNIFDGLLWSPLDGLADRLLVQQGANIRLDGLPADSIAVFQVAAKKCVADTIYVGNLHDSSKLASIGDEKSLASPADVKMRDAASLELTVVDQKTRKPVSGARVNVSQHVSGKRVQQESVTNLGGVAQIDELDPERKIYIRVDPPEQSGQLAFRLTLESNLKDNPILVPVELETGVPLAGRVVDSETGESIANAPVSFRPTGNSRATGLATTETTNSNGEYEILVPPVKGKVFVVGQFEGYVTSVTDMEKMTTKPISVPVDPRLAGNNPPTLKLKRLAVTKKEYVQIKVVDELGEPVKDAKVRFYGRMPGGGTGYPTTQKTDASGLVQIELAQTLFQYRELAIIAVDAEAARSGVAVYDRPKTIIDFEDVADSVKNLVAAKQSEADPAVQMKIELEPIATIRGQVLDADTGQPIGYATVRLHQTPSDEFNISATLFPRVETDEHGMYEVKALAGKKGYLSVEHPAYLRRNTITESDWVRPLAGESLEITNRLVAREVNPNAEIAPFVAPEIGDRTALAAFEFLQDQFTADQKEFRQKLYATTDSAKQQQLARRRDPAPAYIQRMLEIATSNEGKPVEVKALVWACNAPMNSGGDLSSRYKLRSEIGDRLMRDHVDSPEIEPCLDNLVYSQKDPKLAAEKIIAANPKKSIQGKVLLTLGKKLLRDSESNMESWKKGAPNKQMESEAHKIFTRIKNDYADIPYWRHEKLGNIAEMQLFELEHLGIGDSVEDISSIDLDGKPLKLSDYRGKYVVLDFWGSWCGPCVADLPELNKISDEFSDNVVVVGVMNDSPEKAREVIAKNNVTWRNFVEDEDGPIQTRWNINSWPTTYLIGPDGKIIAKQLRGERLHSMIEKLVRRQLREPSKTQ